MALLRFRRFLESLLGIEPVAAGEDTQWHTRFGLGWPDWALALFCVLAVVFVVTIYLREGSVASRRMKLVLAGVRLAIITLAVVMLSGLEISIDRTGLPYLVLMVDDSESMREHDRRGDDPSGTKNRTRLQRVSDWLSRDDGAALRELTAQHKLRLYAHSTTPRLLGTYIQGQDVDELLRELRELQPTGAESRLGANLRTVVNDLRGTPPSSVILITDGVTTQGETLGDAAQYAARKGIPIFTIGVGDPEKLRDLQLHDLLVEDTVFVDDLVTFEAKLTGRGFEGRDIMVRLKQKGIDSPLDEKMFRVSNDGSPTKIRLMHRPTQEGTISYVIDTPVLERETRPDNNRLARDIKVIKEKVRVLYVEAYPRYEFRYLKNLLEREPTAEVKVLLLDADPEYVQQDRAATSYFPTSKQELFEYDVLILGDVAPSLFSQAQLANIREFVRVKGGGFLMIGGPQSAPHAYRESPLADLLPIEIGPSANRARTGSQGFSPRLTVDGRNNPIFRFAADENENDQILASLPVMYWYAAVEKAKPGAQVLAEHPTDTKDGRPVPLVATQFFGAGRSFFAAYDSTWRWRYRVEDLYFSRYWVQTIRYLSRAKLLGKNRNVELLVDRRSYRRGDPVQLRVRFLDESLAPKDDDGVTVLVEHETHGQKSVELKRLPNNRAVFEGLFGQSEDGKYRLRIASPVFEGTAPTADFTVLPPPGELDQVQMNETELRQVAQITGGSYFPIEKADDLFEKLPQGRRVALKTDPPIPLWNTWPMLLLFVGLLLIEWIVRKRKAML